MDTKTSGIEGLSAVIDRRAGNRDLVGEEDLERLRREIQPPTTVTETGRHTEYGYADFFKAKVGNANPRKPYKLAVDRFLFSCREHGFGLRDATSFVIGDYLETYLTDKDRRPLASRSKKQHLTSLRHFFDNQRMFHGIGIKPALSVRGPKYSAHDGKPRHSASER